MPSENIVPNTDLDQQWADHLAPSRRSLITGAGAAIGIASTGLIATAGQALAATPSANGRAGAGQLGTPDFRPIVPPRDEGRSPWGYETLNENPARPNSVRPEGGLGLPDAPRPYTAITSYHAHVYFDEDTYTKAARLRQWVIERFPVELGNWNLEPRGPHVTPSFYFGFTTDLVPVVIPWLQLNSLGLTILLHPNTDDPRADHLYYTLWVNRSQPVNAYGMGRPGTANAPRRERIFPNVTPSVVLES
jgi:DOPA 4,5-dioxygenase